MNLSMIINLASVWIAFILDQILGDPQNWPHPVRWIGWLISTLEKKLRAMFPKTTAGELAAGRELVIFVLMITGAAAWGILRVANRIHPWLAFAVGCIMNYQLLAAKSLKVESMKVCTALERGDTEAARYAVSMIVGRDTGCLDETGITKAAVETVAENASDGVIAPLFYMLFFGPVIAFLYKAVNTMDSMVGYKNERYLYFGRTAAKLDDLVNWIPSRLTAIAMIAAAYLLPGYDGKQAARIWKRDRRNHKSPNSAQSESACAGALGVQLAGDAYYFGELYHKPTIGDPSRRVAADDIRKANQLMLAAAVLVLAAGSVLVVSLF
jgi:adenosylcobinamide-phosphate synthase